VDTRIDQKTSEKKEENWLPFSLGFFFQRAERESHYFNTEGDYLKQSFEWL
jgi:hypothetical protein